MKQKIDFEKEIRNVYIISLFQNMTILTIVLLATGVLLCIIEIFLPRVGLAGILGVVLTLLGFSSYYLDGFKIKHIVSLVSIIAFMLVMLMIIELILEAKGVIKNPDRYKFRTYKVEDGLQSLVGKTGVAVTNIDLGGTVEIEGKLYYAISKNALSSGSIVEVAGVQNNTLVVR